jgi:hypothetical protein
MPFIRPVFTSAFQFQNVKYLAFVGNTIFSEITYLYNIYSAVVTFYTIYVSVHY